jgi:hypothetical protein
MLRVEWWGQSQRDDVVRKFLLTLPANAVICSGCGLCVVVANTERAGAYFLFESDRYCVLSLGASCGFWNRRWGSEGGETVIFQICVDGQSGLGGECGL